MRSVVGGGHRREHGSTRLGDIPAKNGQAIGRIRCCGLGLAPFRPLFPGTHGNPPPYLAPMAIQKWPTRGNICSLCPRPHESAPLVNSPHNRRCQVHVGACPRSRWRERRAAAAAVEMRGRATPRGPRIGQQRTRQNQSPRRLLLVRDSNAHDVPRISAA
jgi:hypothetical protein